MKVNKRVQKTSIKEFWAFSKHEKRELKDKLAHALTALRASANASQEEISQAIGVSRQTYSAIECGKKDMSWNTYMSLILFFDYNMNTHTMIRQLGAFPTKIERQRHESNNVYDEHDSKHSLSKEDEN